MFDNETLLFKYNIDANGNPISIKVDNEQKQVSINGTIQMEFVPDEFNRIDMLDENNQQMYEVFNRDEITTNTYYVDYSSGTIYYDKSQFGKVKIYNYYNRGLQLIGASRLYDEKSITGEGIVKTLQDIIDEGRKCLELIKSLGDAVIIINKLQKNLDDGNILHENLLEDISTGSAVRDDLEEKTDTANTTINSLVTKTQDGNNTVSQLIEKNAIATEKKQALDESIQSAIDTNTTLSNTNQAGTQINLTLQQTMAEASDDIATINATGNKSLIIGASNFTNGEYTWTHSMNNDNLIVSILSTDTNEPIIADYKIIDKNNILIRNSEENPNLKVILSASYYQGNSVIGSTVEEFLGDSIGVGEDKVRLRGVNGEVQNPVTNSDAVFMTDGTTKLTKKINDMDTSFVALSDELDEARGTNQFLGDRLGHIDASLEDIAISVKQFGAKGDGITNDTIAIQNTVNYCTQNNKAVYFPPGVYLITSTITFNRPIEVFGAGQLSKLLLGGNITVSSSDTVGNLINSEHGAMFSFRVDFTASTLSLEHTYDYVNVHDLYFNGNKRQFIADAIHFYVVDHVRLCNVHIEEFNGSAIKAWQLRESFVDNINIRYCGKPHNLAEDDKAKGHPSIVLMSNNSYDTSNLNVISNIEIVCSYYTSLRCLQTNGNQFTNIICHPMFPDSLQKNWDNGTHDYYERTGLPKIVADSNGNYMDYDVIQFIDNIATYLRTNSLTNVSTVWAGRNKASVYINNNAINAVNCQFAGHWGDEQSPSTNNGYGIQCENKGEIRGANIILTNNFIMCKSVDGTGRFYINNPLTQSGYGFTGMSQVKQQMFNTIDFLEANKYARINLNQEDSGDRYTNLYFFDTVANQFTTYMFRKKNTDSTIPVFAQKGAFMLDNMPADMSNPWVGMMFKDSNGNIKMHTTPYGTVTAGESKGFTKASTAPSAPTEGMVWYDTVNKQFKGWNGTSWSVLG